MNNAAVKSQTFSCPTTRFFYLSDTDLNHAASLKVNATVLHTLGIFVSSNFGVMHDGFSIFFSQMIIKISRRVTILHRTILLA